jgi:competence protein ComEC
MDQIKQKLAVLDEQLTSSSQKLFEKTAISAPLLFCATGLIAGIIIQNNFAVSVFIWLILLALVIIGLFAFSFFPKITPKNTSYALYTFSCFLCLGAIRLISFQQPQSNDIHNLVGQERQLATVRGIILTEPRTEERQWQFAKFSHTDPRSSFYLQLREIETTDGWAKVTGDVRVQVDEKIRDLKGGDSIEVLCWLDRFKNATNPGQFDIAKYLARNNVFVAASVKSRDSITLLKNRGTGTFAKIRRKLSRIATVKLLDSPYAFEQSQKLLQALVLGYRADIGADIYIAFRKTGLLHFICLSGMNFGIVIGIVWWFCRRIGLMKPARAGVCIIAALLFLLVIPPQAPAFRAAIMCSVFCASFFFNRHPNTLNSLSLAAIVLLLINPMQLVDIGWQLSFAAVLGIILFTESIHFFCYEKITNHPWILYMPKTNLFFRITSSPSSFSLNVFSVSFAAWLATSGIMLYHFYTINVFTTIWTVIVSPLIAVVSVLGYIKMILALVLPTVASWLNPITFKLADWLIALVKFLAALDKTNILVGHVPLVFIVFCYTVVFFAAFAHLRPPKIKAATLSLMFLVVIIFLGAVKFQRTYHKNLVITCLDVGHGQAIIAQLPGSKTCLFDAGSQNLSDIGTRTIAPFLSYNGISKLDAIFISHGDIDHINGIPEVVKFCDVGAIYADETFPKTQKSTVKFLNNWLSERGFETQPVQNNTIAGIKTIWPNDIARLDNKLTDNDKSVVTLIESGNSKVLLCSDTEKTAQTKLLQLFPNLNPDVVVVPHHGSLRTRSAGFLDALDADIFVYSCSERLFDSLKKSNQPIPAKSFYTCTDGAIIISFDENGTIKTTTSVRK